MSSAAPASASKPSTRRRFTVDALFADGRPQAVGVTDLTSAKEIRLDRIVPDPAQPRKAFDAIRLEELAASISQEGVLQPIVVRYDETDDIYVIVHGERRWRAARLVGKKSIPAMVRDVDEDRRLVQQLMENIVREDLNALDRAKALRILKIRLDDAPWDAVAETVGIKRSRLFQLLGTEKLPELVQEDIRAGRLSEKQSRALHGLSPAVQLALRDSILADGLTADEAAKLARGLRQASLDDDPGAATLKIAELLRRQPINEDVDPIRFLQALTAAHTSESVARTELNQLARQAWAAPYDSEWLEAQVLAIARTLSKAPVAEFRPSSRSYLLLVALRDALASLTTTRLT